ncbi:MAG: ferredoxin [Candidatus Moranbacteria bacterium]|nr:ferredoxin [Candidatus Moranbacteria bacterium]
MGINKISVSQKRDDCIGCGACTSFAPNNWSMNGQDGKADLKDAVKKGDMMVVQVDEDQVEENKQAADACPVQIIKVSGHNE